MTVQPPPPSATPTTPQNATPLSQHVLTLFQKAQVQPLPGLLLASLAWWAKDNLDVPAPWAQALEQALALAEDRDPAAAYAAMETPAILDAETLKEAGLALLRRLVDLIPADTQPA